MIYCRRAQRALAIVALALGGWASLACRAACPSQAAPNRSWVETPVGRVELPVGWSLLLIDSPGPTFVLYSPDGEVEVRIIAVERWRGEDTYAQALKSLVDDLRPDDFDFAKVGPTSSYGEKEVAHGRLFAICAEIVDPSSGRTIVAIAASIRANATVSVDAYRSVGGRDLLCSLAASAKTLKERWQ